MALLAFWAGEFCVAVVGERGVEWWVCHAYGKMLSGIGWLLPSGCQEHPSLAMTIKNASWGARWLLGESHGHSLAGGFSTGAKGRGGVCAEVQFGKGWNLDHEIFMDFRSWKAPREVTWAGPQTLTVLSMAKGKGRERDISPGPACCGSSIVLFRGSWRSRVSGL